MKVVIQNLPFSRIELRIEVPAEEFDQFYQKAILNFGKDLEIPGFRKGKIPKNIIEKEIGREKILKEAAEIAIKENYLKAILENKIEPLSQPEIEILKLPAPHRIYSGAGAPGNPLEFKAKTSVLPEVKLLDYKKIASEVKKREIEVTKDEIENLRLEKERLERERFRQEILDEIAKDTEIEIPEILIREEKKRMLESLKRQVPQILQISFEDYLKKISKSEEELLDSFLAEARRRIKNSLVLREIEKKENIEVSDEEIKKETSQILKFYPETKKLDPEQLKDYTKEIIKNEKTFQFLEKFSRY